MTGKRNVEYRGDGSGGGSTAVLLVGLLLLTVPLVGCADDGGDDGEAAAGGDANAITAEEGLSDADEVADNWDEDADLGAVVSKEGGQPHSWPAGAFAYQEDGSIGDGAIPQWGYIYVLGDGELRGVYLNADGETYTEESQDDAFSDPLASWEVDSDEAVEAAKDDEDFAAVVEADDAQVDYTLSQPDEEGAAPVWWLEASSSSMGEDRTIMVDGETGETEAPFG